MNHTIQKEVRDPVHGYIYRSTIEEKIIDTRVFQRLRRIKQLAMANLIYPGANHTRFDHSLGTMHIAGEMAKKIGLSRLGKDENGYCTVRVTALLHDIGHGPFSHVSEELLGYFNKDRFNGSDRNTIHEVITRDIIEKNEELTSIISGQQINEIIQLLQKNDTGRQERDIISGPLDADKLDYLLRDSYFTGVKYGVFDLPRIINTLQQLSLRDGTQLCIHKDGLYALEQFFMAKYHMTKQVYHHKGRHITDAMIVKGIVLGVEQDHIKELRDLYYYDDSMDYLKNYLNYYDERIFNIILNNNGKFSRYYFDRLSSRKLFKRVFHRPLIAVFNNAVVRLDMQKMKDFTAIEGKIADKIKCDRNYVIFKIVRYKNILNQLGEDIDRVLVIDKNNRPEFFDKVSSLFGSINQADDQLVEVYIPFKYDSSDEKNRKLKDLEDKIQEVLSAIN